MRNRKTRRVTARYNWDRLKVSFWFAPVVMGIAAIFLAWLMYELDSRIPNEVLENSRLVLSGSPGEMRSMLVGMASSILATAGVVFTLLTLPLSTVAAQYGSRLLRVFLGDRTTQLVLATFVATFVYCLAAALSIPPTEVEREGPQLTVTLGMVFMLASFASLILLVQHISTMLQAPNIAAAAGDELRDVVLAEMPEEIFRDEKRKAGSDQQADLLAEKDGYVIRVREGGYIQYIDPHYVVTLAQERDVIIRLLRRPGHVVWHDTPVALVWPAGRVDEELDRQIRHAFRIGNVRTPTQDIVYGVNQLVEMAERAMSPAINDPFTAMTCLDYIGQGLALFVKHGENSPYYYDQNHRLRLFLEPVTFTELLDSAFEMLRHASRDNARVMMHMLGVIAKIGQAVNSVDETWIPAARQELARHTTLIQAESQAGNLIEQDRELITQRSEALKTLFSTEPMSRAPLQRP